MPPFASTTGNAPLPRFTRARARRTSPHQRAGRPPVKAARNDDASGSASKSATRRRSRRSASWPFTQTRPDRPQLAGASRTRRLARRHRRRAATSLGINLRVPRVLGDVFSHRRAGRRIDGGGRGRAPPAGAAPSSARRRTKACDGASPLCWHCGFVLLLCIAVLCAAACLSCVFPAAAVRQALALLAAGMDAVEKLIRTKCETRPHECLS